MNITEEQYDALTDRYDSQLEDELEELKEFLRNVKTPENMVEKRLLQKFWRRIEQARNGQLNYQNVFLV